MNESTSAAPGWYKTPNGMMWWTGSEWAPDAHPEKKIDRPRVWVVYLLGLLFAPAGAIDATIQASKAKKLGFSTTRYWVAFSIFAAVTLIAVISILSSIGSGSSAPALVPGQATADQICQSMVGQSLQNTLTGQNLNEKVVSEADATITSNLNASGNEVATCNFTLDTGALLPATVTLFANGSIGMHGGT